MGVWSVSINGNDTASDLKHEYDAVFAYNSVSTSIEKLDHYVKAELNDDEWCDYVYSLADYVWKKGILTEEIKERALHLIDNNIGLEVYAEAGEQMLKKRRKVLQEFREKICSPQPPQKKIKVNLYTTPIFEAGDIIALRLKTLDKFYVQGQKGWSDCKIDEEQFRAMHDKYVVFKKIQDDVSYKSSVEPRVKDIWPVFRLYDKIFDTLPTMENLKKVPYVIFYDKDFAGKKTGMDVFRCEGSITYFKRRDYVIIGHEEKDLLIDKKHLHKDNTVFNPHSIYFGINRLWCNADTDIIKAINLKEKSF